MTQKKTTPATAKTKECSECISLRAQLAAAQNDAGMTSQIEALTDEKNAAIERANELAIEVGKSEAREKATAKKLQKFAEQEGTLTVI